MIIGLDTSDENGDLLYRSDYHLLYHYQRRHTNHHTVSMEYSRRRQNSFSTAFGTLARRSTYQYK